ncbi:MAG: ribonuclease D [Mariprofundaceae bacterium]
MQHIKPVYIDTPAKLDETCQRLADAPLLTIDTEFHREKTYYPTLGLVQVAMDGDYCALFDPVALDGLDPLWDVIYQPHIMKVFHAARQDMEILLYIRGTLPAPIFDTQVAAAMLGMGEQIGFGNLVHAITDRRLAKAESFSDWLTRPLKPSQLTYAADDVTYLLPVYKELKSRLESSGRLAWLQEEQARLCDPESYANHHDEVFWRVKSVNTLRPHQLAVLRELAAWREKRAQKANQPRRRILSDEVLMTIARKTKLSLEDMRHMRGMPGGTVDRRGDELLAAWQRGYETEKQDWPRIRRSNGTRGSELRADLLATLLKMRAREENIAPSMLASRGDLLLLAARTNGSGDIPDDIPCLQGWRRDIVGNDLLNLLHGKTCLRLDPDNGKPIIAPIA